MLNLMTIFIYLLVRGENGTLHLHMFTHALTHTQLESYCEEGTPVGITIATLINRTCVDVTWCYQILIKLL